ncbi:MAG TPA: hypothetical protein VIR57_06395 [Chloroflexota bacterium]
MAASVLGTDEPIIVRFAVRAAFPRFLMLALFAVAMGYLEAAAVLYLRTLYGGIDPVGPRNPPMSPLPDFGAIEIAREAATMAMLAAVGWLAGPRRARFGAFVMAFGMWDTCYYAFLWLLTGWPASPLAPDILFLMPLPWWGPVIAPVLIAALMVVGGGLAMARELGDGLPRMRASTCLVMAVGCVLCLTAFMLDAIGTLPHGLAAAFEVRGGPFPWPLYAVGLVVMSAGALLAIAQRHDGYAGRLLRARSQAAANAPLD